MTFSDGSIGGPFTGVTLEYAAGAICPYTNTPYSFKVNVFCDPATKTGDYNPIADTTNPCSPVVTLISKYGCSVLSVSELWTYLN